MSTALGSRSVALRHNHTDDCIFNLPRDKPSFGRLFLQNGGIDPVTYGGRCTCKTDYGVIGWSIALLSYLKGTQLVPFNRERQCFCLYRFYDRNIFQEHVV